MLNGIELQVEIIVTVKNVLTNDGEGHGHYIRIARFAGELDATPQDIAQAFIDLQRAKLIDLAPESNTKVLRPADHLHAVQLGSDACHLVAFQV